MKIYIDVCCYNRPFDNPAHLLQASVQAEITAIMSALEVCRVENFSVIGSPAVVLEINKIQNDVKRRQVMGFYLGAKTEEIQSTDDIEARTQQLIGLGLRMLDSYHVAFSEAANVDYLLTTDTRLVNAAPRMGLKIKVINPIKFLQEYAVWLQSSM